MAIVIVGLGDCAPGNTESIDLLAQRLGERYGHPIVEACILTPRSPQLSEAFTKCVDRGARKLLIVPYVFELDARELWDFARAVREEARNLRGVRVVIGKPLGFDESLVHLVDKRVRESQELPDVRELDFMKREQLRNAPRHQIPSGERIDWDECTFNS